MDFEVHYLGFTIGRSRMSVGRPEAGVVPVQLSSGPAGMTASLKFHQTLVSDLDLATLLPRSTLHDASEPGGYKHTDTTRHDRAAHKATVREKGRFDNTYEIDVPPEAFQPPPEVDSAVVRLRPLDAARSVPRDEELFARVVTQAFAQRRKTLRNTLKGLVTAAELDALGIDPGRRAQELSVAEFARLAAALAQQRDSD
jgi:hypothetical protein